MKTVLDWDDGSGDKLTLTYSANSGVQQVVITSDPHSGFVARARDIEFSVTAGGVTVTQTLTVTQLGRNLTVTADNNVVTTDTQVVHGDET